MAFKDVNKPGALVSIGRVGPHLLDLPCSLKGGQKTGAVWPWFLCCNALKNGAAARFGFEQTYSCDPCCHARDRTAWPHLFTLKRLPERPESCKFLHPHQKAAAGLVDRLLQQDDALDLDGDNLVAMIPQIEHDASCQEHKSLKYHVGCLGRWADSHTENLGTLNPGGTC